ncbi:hypothetical protein PTKIN_Ptkin03bG0151600 [Pterospermum kingtungense]
MAVGAVEMMFRSVFEGSITMQDSLIERRPYHRNCDCALHKLKGVCSSACSHTRNISFPKKHQWDNCSWSLSASNFSSQSFLLDVSSIRISPEEVNAALYQPAKMTQQTTNSIQL